MSLQDTARLERQRLERQLIKTLEDLIASLDENARYYAEHFAVQRRDAVAMLERAKQSIHEVESQAPPTAEDHPNPGETGGDEATQDEDEGKEPEFQMGLPKSRIIAEAIDTVGGKVMVTEVIRLLRRYHPPQRISDKDVRRVISRVANMEDPALILLHRGSGVNPNVYRRVRSVADMFQPKSHNGTHFTQSNAAAG